MIALSFFLLSHSVILVFMYCIREWASALQSKPRGGAPLVSNTSPFGTSSNSGGSNTHSLEPVETRLLQRLQLQAGVTGDESTYSSPNNDDVRGEAWRLRRSFREAERHHHLHRGGEGYSGAVPMEVWFDVLKRHRFQDLLTRAQVSLYLLVYQGSGTLIDPGKSKQTSKKHNPLCAIPEVYILECVRIVSTLSSYSALSFFIFLS